MRKIEIKKLRLANFKGIRSLVIDFAQETNIYGDNATGKTTIFDGFLWLLFGKDSAGREDFEIKTLDDKGNPYRRLDHEVEGWLVVDDEEIILKKTYREKWTKKRGSAETEFTGHETVYFWNEVPLKEIEYKAKIAQILDEKVFKLLTNTTYFNSLKWQERRAVLLQLAGEIDDTDILEQIGATTKSSDLARALEKGKTLAEFKAEIGAKKKKIQDEIKQIPARIDEAQRTVSDHPEFDVDELKKSLALCESEAVKIDNELLDARNSLEAEDKELARKMNVVQELRRKSMNIEFSVTNRLLNEKQVKQNRLLDYRRAQVNKEEEIRRANMDLVNQQTIRAAKKMEQDSLRENWNRVNAEKLPELDPNEFKCPTCGHSLEHDAIEEKIATMKKNFNEDKSQRLTSISNRGKKLGEEIAQIDTTISNLDAIIENTKVEVDSLKSNILEAQIEIDRLTNNEAAEVDKALRNSQEYQASLKLIAAAEAEVNKPRTAQDTSFFVGRKKELSDQMVEIRAQLQIEEQREKARARVRELEESEREMAQQLATLESSEFAITQFERAKMDLVESRVNDRFHLVKFKLFETQVNSGEVLTCVTLVNGVPYPDANYAAKAQAGLDIINVLSDHFQVVAPVFFDNRESVVEIPETRAQVVNLIVKEGAKLSVGKVDWLPAYKEKNKLISLTA